MRYIKLFDKITEWEWYDDPITFKVFLHLLLTANWKDTRWHGVVIHRGQRVISYSGLATEIHVSVRQIRTAMEHLKATCEVTCKSTNKCTVVTVENYEKYQGEQKSTDTQNDTPRVTQTTTDIELYRTIENNKTPTVSMRHQIPPTLEMVRAYCKERNNAVDPERFYDFYQSKNWFVGKNKMKDWQAAVRTWEKDDDHKRINETASRPAADVTPGERESVEQWLARQRSRTS